MVAGKIHLASKKGDGPFGPTLPDILEEHLEELAFLSIQRRKLLFAPDVTVGQFRRHDERIEAHRDALSIGSQTSIDLAIKKLEEPEAWELYAAARTWIELASPNTEVLLARVATTPPELFPAWRETFRRLSTNVLKRCLPPQAPLLEECLPSLQGILLDAWGWHGILPSIPTISNLSRSEDEGVRCALARALGQGCVSGNDDSRILDLLLLDSSVTVQRTALWSATIRNTQDPTSKVRYLAQSEHADPFTLRVLGLVGTPMDVDVLLSHVKRREAGAAAIRALGDLGNPKAGSLLVEMMESDAPDLTLAAGDALQALAGPIPPSEPKAGDVSTARAFWMRLEPTFRGQPRWLRGKPFPPSGETENASMETLWRLSVPKPTPETAWLRREVPDGFFTAMPLDEAIPGE